MRDFDTISTEKIKSGSPSQKTYTMFLTKALNNIDHNYYRVTKTYDDIVRERVFCSELYHQIRLIQKGYSLGTLHP